VRAIGDKRVDIGLAERRNRQPFRDQTHASSLRSKSFSGMTRLDVTSPPKSLAVLTRAKIRRPTVGGDRR
jgi:hypothetical protein